MFSVVIPLYNKSDYILNSVNSVLNQTFRNFELIIVDDGSTDNSLEIVKPIMDIRIKVFSKSNGGVSDARNFGIMQSNRSYIALLDADDIWNNNYLFEMSALIETFPYCGMYNSGYQTIRNGKVIYKSSKIENKMEIVSDYFKRSLTESISWTSATILSRNAIFDVGLFPVGMISGEDSFVWTKIAKKFPIAFNHKILVTYNLNYTYYFNRIKQKDNGFEKWQDLMEHENISLNTFIAIKALSKGIRYAWGGFKAESLKIEKDFEFIKSNEHVLPKWRKLYYLNRMPVLLLDLVVFFNKKLIKK